MTFWERRDAVLDDLRRRRARGAAAPFLYRWLWAVGVPVRPPQYQSIPAQLAIQVPFYWAAMAVPAGAFTVAIVGPRAFPIAVVIAGAMAAAVGVMSALGTRAEAARLRLPRWDAFDPYLPDPDADW